MAFQIQCLLHSPICKFREILHWRKVGPPPSQCVDVQCLLADMSRNLKILTRKSRDIQVCTTSAPASTCNASFCQVHGLAHGTNTAFTSRPQTRLWNTELLAVLNFDISPVQFAVVVAHGKAAPTLLAILHRIRRHSYVLKPSLRKSTPARNERRR